MKHINALTDNFEIRLRLVRHFHSFDAVVLFQMMFNSADENGNFQKFIQPCDHPDYEPKKRMSWEEETLVFGEDLRPIHDSIVQYVTTDNPKDDTSLVWCWGDPDGLLRYKLNDAGIERMLEECYE